MRFSTLLLSPKTRAFCCVFVAAFHTANVLAEGDHSAPLAQVTQAGGKNRISFDYTEGPGATPTIQPSPTPVPVTKPLVNPEIDEQTQSPAATATPVSFATPVTGPLASPPPSPATTGSGEPTPSQRPSVSPHLATEPAPNAVPPPEPVAPSSTPTAFATPESQLPKAEPEAKPVAATVDSAPVPTEEPANPQTDVITMVENTAIATEPPLGGVPETSERRRTASESVTINLINKLVERGILTKEDAKVMITQAEAEADAQRAQTQADMFSLAMAAASQAAADQIAIAQANSPGGNSADDVRVTYIPEPVKTQIKEDIKMELISESRRGGGGYVLAPQLPLPAWVSRVRPMLDFRFRYEGDFFPNGNDATGAFPNFNAINTGAPFDVTGNQFAPQYNVDQDRNRFRIRIRMGAEVDMGDSLTAGIRLATGENNSPVTTNQTVGLANNGQGGNFSRYAIWLDRAFMRYDLGPRPWVRQELETSGKNVVSNVRERIRPTDWGVSLWVGRFDNPFFGTSLIWDDDLGFDGVAIQGHYEVVEGITPFITAGGFPVYNTDFNYSSNQPAKFPSYDKYLFGGQIGVDVEAIKDWRFKFAAAYYYFHNIEGKLSDPYVPQSANDASNTDNSRPSFAQKGNTYFPIRNIVPDASNQYGAINQWQYYGLATKFQELAITGRIDYNGFEPVQVSLIGEFVQNLEFNQADMNLIAVNNRGSLDDNLANDIGAFDGSGTGWIVELRVGSATFNKAWDWRLMANYRWVGSDATVDAFNDSDFGLGGTNMKGFTVGGALAFSPHLWMGLRWMGAESLAGPQFKSNIIQWDLHSEF
jgi:hypothetical protein